jgi:ABC-type transport system involved in multi-copper enzyme maturation permease subunit
MTVKSQAYLSNLQIIRTLLAKDWRLYRVPVIALLLVSLGCYLLGIVGTMYRWSEYGGPRDAFFAAAIIAANITALLASIFGGVAIAGERGNRTADFMAMLPVRRGKIILSKWLISGVVVIAFGTVNGLVALLLMIPNRIHEWPYWHFELAASDAGDVALWVGCAMCFFGTAWLLSTSIRSAAISSCISIATTACIASFVAICMGRGRHHDWVVECTTALTLAMVGLANLVAGTIYYLRRIAP